MTEGTGDLARAITAYAACLAFGLTYLLAVFLGADGLTAVIRGAVVAVVTLVVGKPLARPLIGTILDAVAKSKTAKGAEGTEEP